MNARMRRGVVWCIGGVAVTAISYLLAIGGGYVVTWGAVIYGVYEFLMGLDEPGSWTTRKHEAKGEYVAPMTRAVEGLPALLAQLPNEESTSLKNWLHQLDMSECNSKVPSDSLPLGAIWFGFRLGLRADDFWERYRKEPKTCFLSPPTSAALAEMGRDKSTPPSGE